MAGARRRGSAWAIAVAVAVCGGPATTSSALASRSVGGQVVDAATIRDKQIAVVNRNDQVLIRTAERLVGQYQSNIGHDRQLIADDTSAGEAAALAQQAATGRLAADSGALTQTEASLAAAQNQVDGDRARLRALAIGTYTGKFTNPQPSGSPTPQAAQQAAIDVAEVKVVAGIVDRRLGTDLVSVVADSRIRDQLTSAVGVDGQAITAAGQDQSAAASRLRTDNVALGSDQRGLPAAQAQLSQAESTLRLDLASLNPVSSAAGSVSLLGGSALTAPQLAAWYRWEGYTDFTSAPIDQLSAWYTQAGAQEGVRGDVAFAQAILETGGFSSPDAVDFNNYAGIGHCDSCASGWQFPSPNGGVVGQIQLLRIFATTAAPPAGAPGPVLPSLTVSKQHEAGCCPSVESLTGVWATDPTYDTQILGIYQQMLDYALSQR